MDDLLVKNLVQESLSPYIVLALLVYKNDGFIQMCVDIRVINKITIKYRFPIPRMKDMLDKLQEDSLFSILDLTIRFV